MNIENITVPLQPETVVALQPELVEQAPQRNVLQKIGELPTKAAIYAHIKTADAIDAVNSAFAVTKEHLQRKGGKIAAHVGLIALTLGGAGLGALKESSTAYADNPAVYQIVDGPWYLHPNSSTIQSDTSELMPTGTNFAISCWQEGDNVNGDSVWDYGTDESTGLQGYVADKGTNTPVTMGNEPAQLTALGIPECGTATPTSEFPPATSSGYNGQGAANWALANAEDTQPSAFVSNDETCTIFVARAVIEGGGLQETPDFNLEDWYRHAYIGQHGTADTWLAPNLIKYILNKYPDSSWQPLDFSQNNQSEVQPGDIIAYSWSDNGQGNPDDINHLAIVVDDAPGTQYPEVAEWGNLKPGQSAADYQKTGWTWSAYYNNWIQQATLPDGTKAYPNPHAYLLHIVVPSY